MIQINQLSKVQLYCERQVSMQYWCSVVYENSKAKAIYYHVPTPWLWLNLTVSRGGEHLEGTRHLHSKTDIFDCCKQSLNPLSHPSTHPSTHPVSIHPASFWRLKICNTILNHFLFLYCYLCKNRIFDCCKQSLTRLSHTPIHPSTHIRRYLSHPYSNFSTQNFQRN